MSVLVGLAHIPVLDVDPVELDGAAVRLRNAVADIGSSTVQANAAWRGLRDVYDVSGAGALMAKAAIVESAGTDVKEAVTKAANAVQALADNLAAAKRRCDALRTEIPAHRQAVFSYRAEAAEDWGVHDRAQLSLWGYGQWEANSTLTNECIQVQRLIDQAVEECVTTLNSIQDVPAQVDFALSSTGSFAMGSLGTTHIGAPMASFASLHGTFAQIVPTTEAYRQALLTTGRGLITEMLNGGLDDADMATLTLVFEQTGDDPELASALWTGVGGAQTLEFYSELASNTYSGSVDQDVLTLAVAARASISSASEMWGDNQAQRYADGAFPLDDPDAVKLLAFLFNDPAAAPMSASFAVAAANVLDRAERSYVREPLAQGVRVSQEHGGISVLTQVENWAYADSSGADRDVLDARAQDPAVGVLSTLALYPDSALEWLAGGEPADRYGYEVTGFSDQRAYYWIGQRDWRHDGGTVAMQLWESALSVDGGVGDSSTPYTGTPAQEAIHAQQATVTAYVFDSLSDTVGSQNRILSPDYLSVEAQQSLGRNLATSLPWLAEGSIAKSAEAPTDALFDDDEGFKSPMPWISVSDAARVWGSSAEIPDVFFEQHAAVEKYTGLLPGVDSEVADVERWKDDVAKAVRVMGFHDGSVGGHAEMQARLSDDRVQAGIDGVGATVSLGTIPAGPAVSALATLTTEIGGDMAAEFWAARHESAVQHNFDERISAKEKLELIIAGRAQGLDFPNPRGFSSDMSSAYDWVRKDANTAIDEDYKSENSSGG